MYSAQRAIQVIDEILEKDTYDWIKELTEQTNIMRFNTVIGTEEYKQALNENKIEKAKNIARETMKDNEEELIKILKEEVSEDKIIRFVERQINRIITKYEK